MARLRYPSAFQCGHLFALGRHQARRHDVQQEGGHRQEDRRQDAAQQVLFADLVVQHRVRHLLDTAVRRNAAEGGELARGLLDHGGARGAGGELERDLVPCAFHVHRGRQLLLVDPEHAEGAQVGHAPQASEDVLGGHGRARDAQGPQLAVDQRGDGGARLQAMRAGESFRHERLELAAGAAAALRQAAGAQAHAIELLRVAQVEPDQAPDHRVGGPRQAHARTGLHRRLHGQHAVDGREARAQAVGRALDAGEDVGEAAALVEEVARAGQRIDGRQARDEAADTAGHHQRDRDGLAPQQLQVAQRLAVDGFHGVTTTVPRA
jgi:hypothetical protein